MPNQLFCCVGCGRDTRAKSKLCADCCGHSNTPHVGAKRRFASATHEDDYGEESSRKRSRDATHWMNHEKLRFPKTERKSIIIRGHTDTEV